MDPQEEIADFLRTRGMLSAINVARRYGATGRGAARLQQLHPGLSGVAASILIGQAAQSVLAGEQLQATGAINQGTAQRMLRQTVGGGTPVVVAVEVDISDLQGNHIRYVTVRIPVEQQMDRNRLDELIFRAVEAMQGASEQDMDTIQLSYEITGAYGA